MLFPARAYVRAMHGKMLTQGSSIVGLSRKGKEFFKMASPLSETIHHMAVQDDRCVRFPPGHGPVPTTEGSARDLTHDHFVGGHC